ASGQPRLADAVDRPAGDSRGHRLRRGLLERGPPGRTGAVDDPRQWIGAVGQCCAGLHHAVGAGALGPDPGPAPSGALMGKPPPPIRNRIRQLRFNANEMTQADLAARIGMTRQTIVAMEQGKYSPSLETAFRIAQTFGVEIGEVFQWEG